MNSSHGSVWTKAFMRSLCTFLCVSIAVPPHSAQAFTFGSKDSNEAKAAIVRGMDPNFENEFESKINEAYQDVFGAHEQADAKNDANIEEVNLDADFTKQDIQNGEVDPNSNEFVDDFAGEGDAKVTGEGDPITHEQFKKLSSAEQFNYIVGQLRKLDLKGKHKFILQLIPLTKGMSAKKLESFDKAIFTGTYTDKDFDNLSADEKTDLLKTVDEFWDSLDLTRKRAVNEYLGVKKDLGIRTVRSSPHASWSALDKKIKKQGIKIDRALWEAKKNIWPALRIKEKKAIFAELGIVLKPPTFVARVGNHFLNMGNEMAKFYFAIAVLSAWECWSKRDPTICSSYYQSLKDPVGHVGFYLFMVSSHATGMGFNVLSKGRLSGSYFGLATGMLVQTMFQEIWTHPSLVQWRKDGAIKDPVERRKKRLEDIEKVWDGTLASGEWWLDKVPDVTSLIGAAAISPVSLRIAKGVLGVTKNVLQFSVRNRQTWAMYRTIGGPKTERVMNSGLRFLFKNNRIVRFGPVVKFGGWAGRMGTYLVETIVFLKWAEWIGDPLREWWDVKVAFNKLGSATKKFERFLTKKDVKYDAPKNELQSVDNAPQVQKLANQFAKELENDPEYIKDQQLTAAMGDVAKAWDNYRAALMMPASMAHSRHATEIVNIDTQQAQLFFSYVWLTQGKHTDDDDEPWSPGMNTGDKTWTENSLGWHDMPYNVVRSLKDFFCGRDVTDSLRKAIEYWSIPVPGWETNKVRAFRVVNDDRYCEKGLPSNLTQKMAEDAARAACAYGPNFCPASQAYLVSNPRKILSSSEIRELYLESVQRRALAQNNYSKQLDEAFATHMNMIEPLRLSLIRSYERVVQKTLTHALTGQSTKLDASGNVVISGTPDTRTLSVDFAGIGRRSFQVADGAIPSYDAEKQYWEAVALAHPELKKNTGSGFDALKQLNIEELNETLDLFHSKIDSMLDAVEAKKEAAQSLLDYSVLSPKKRSLPSELAWISESGDMSRDAWLAEIEDWKTFVLGNH